ncbi:hypothetical protein QNH14_00360 [Apirhabdus apintestini]|nr:hypothetical protein [Erwinia sp. HR93]MEA1063246.1 hypothetical protein [Erwinia sp. HR93]WPM85020.1 hypothetical protein QNH14_00360 [Enterobacteriaceae bacterium CA-0114]
MSILLLRIFTACGLLGVISIPAISEAIAFGLESRFQWLLFG